MKLKNPTTLRDEAEAEAYQYFDKNIRPLPKDASGKIDSNQNGFQDNDVDAFRHAYVSGVFTQEYGETTADIFGRMNEMGLNAYSNSRNPKSKNMDLWNNSIGRKYGLKSKDRQSLADNLLAAMKRGELIPDLKDKRKYKGASHNAVSKGKPVIVLHENEKGRNELYYDTITDQILTVAEFIALIEKGKYPTYAVKMIHGVLTPVSNPDNRKTNNLG